MWYNLKKYLVDYVGEKLGDTSDEVTTEMIVEVMSKEFPDFLLVIAEENYFRGYAQAIKDYESLQGERTVESTTSP